MIPTYELVEADFPIAPGVTLPVGREYSFTRYRVQGNTANRRPIAVSPQVEWGSFYSGDRLRLGMTVNLRAAPGQMFTFANEWNRVSLAEGRFDTRLYRVIAETQVNPRVSLVNNVQYDSQAQSLLAIRFLDLTRGPISTSIHSNWLMIPLETGSHVDAAVVKPYIPKVLSTYTSKVHGSCRMQALRQRLGYCPVIFRNICYHGDEFAHLRDACNIRWSTLR